MLKIGRYFASLLLFLSMSSVLVSNSYGKGYKGFKLLNPDECSQLDKKVVSQLPVEWHKYADFVKICKLKEKGNTDAKVSIISIWINDYYDTTVPTGAPHIWENFPLTLIVDSNLHIIGKLPEIYPMNDITSPDVYYGKWKSGIPTEIRIDVNNPAVEGDYYYSPLIWDIKSLNYKMKSKEVTYGRRPK